MLRKWKTKSLAPFLSLFCALALTDTVFAAEKIYVKNYTPLLSHPSEKAGTPLKNLRLNEVVTIIYREETLGAQDDSQIWVRVRADDGREGFVTLANLSKEKQEEPEFQIAFRDIEKKMYVTADALYIRNEPSRDSSEMGMLVRNTEVMVIKYSDADDYIDGMSAKWARVKVSDELEGWMFAGYLSETPRASATGPNNEPKEDPNHILSGSSKTVKPPFLAVRDEPTRFGTALGRIKQGKSVRILERRESWESFAGLRSVWVRVRYDDLEGWVFGGFLSSAGYTMSSDSFDKPFILPLDVDHYRRTGNYGKRVHPIFKTASFHTGVDLGAAEGTTIYAAADGVVEVESDNTGYGILTVVRHPNGYVTYYGHQIKRYKSVGDKVVAGEAIGQVGSTGNSTGDHLHFEVRKGYNDTHFNPDLYVPFPEAPHNDEN